MIYNETLKQSYGSAPEAFRGNSPMRYIPNVTENDYRLGYIKRTFAKKANEDVIVEIKCSDASGINLSLYKIVGITWKISGPRNNLVKNEIIDKCGVTEQNQFEVDRANTEDGVDLSTTLPNLLEFWRGY
jgi:hypothetical protein